VAVDPAFAPPLLLAGPILRKVTASSASVWVATSQSCDVQLNVYGQAAFATLTGKPVTPVSGTIVGTGSLATVKVGAALHVAVVTAPIDGVPPDTVCSYDIVLNVLEPGPLAHALAGPWNLGGLKLLDLGDSAADYHGGLGFAEGRLPSFLTPPADYADLRIWQGSCFSLKGDGSSIMPALDDILSDALPADATAQKERPHLLMLTGDQIYADDVSTSLLPSLTTIGENLLRAAGTETVPIDGVTGANVSVDQDSLPAGRRLKLVRVSAGMTSDDGDDHLIGFGEFAAMYLLTWTGRLTDRLAEPYKPLWPAANDLAVLPTSVADPPADATPNAPVVLAKVTSGPAEALLTPLFAPDSTPGKIKYIKQIAEVVVPKFAITRRDMQKAGDDGDLIRRVLANVPTLMICDDHEVTDDFFIRGNWRKRVLGTKLGRAIFRNALLAYVLFQGWGNTPEAFATAGSPEAQLLKLVPQMFTGTQVPDPGICAQVDKLLGIDDLTGTNTSPKDAVAFNYHVDLAGARLVVLDTRRYREYLTLNSLPGLLSPDALDAQLPISLTDDVPLLIVVSPAPVLGPRVMEELLLPIATHAYDLHYLAAKDDAKVAAGFDVRSPYGEFWIDVEQWSARPESFERFLARISRCPRVVILAGDVHYAASFVMDYQRFDVPAVLGGVPPPDPPPPGGSTSRIVNFTSSPFRNEWPHRIPALARTIGIIENIERFGFDGARLGWTRMLPPVIKGEAQASGEARPLRARLRREPVVLPTVGWSAPHDIRPPEWAYQVTALFDQRSDDVRFADLADTGFTQVLGTTTPDAPLPPPTPPFTTPSWVEPRGPYDVGSALHAANLDGGAVTRTLVFQNNVGLVTFKREHPSDPLTVEMALYFMRAYPTSLDEKPHKYVVHTTQLEPEPMTAPTSVGPVTSQGQT
jgi:hypothetical protein